MIALVVISMFVVLLLGILVAGLLRSHADILRSLHELGLGVGDPARHEARVRCRRPGAGAGPAVPTVRGAGSGPGPGGRRRHPVG